MDDKTLQKKLDEFVKLGNELDAEAKKRYGAKGFLFHEADGGIHVMDGDLEGVPRNLSERQSHIRFSANGHVRWGAGAW
jgi:hypothetical protein